MSGPGEGGPAPVRVSAITAKSGIGKTYTRDLSGKVRSGLVLWFKADEPTAATFNYPTARDAIAEMLAAPSSTMFLAGTWRKGMEGARVSPGARGPTLENLAFSPAPGICVIDADRKAAGKDCHALNQPFEFPSGPPELLAILAEIAPELSRTVAFDSSSSWIATADGQQVKGAGGLHALFGVADATRIPHILEILDKRAVIAGYGWAFVADNGIIHRRSLIDLALARPTQPNFMRPVLGEGLIRKGSRQATYEGDDLLADLPDLTDDEEQEYERRARQLEDALRDAAAERAAVFAAEQGKRAKERAGGAASVGYAAERAVAIAVSKGEVLGSLPLRLKDGRTVLASEVLAKRAAFDGLDCADPVDPDYRGGKVVARIFTNPRDPDAPAIIYSHAHGAPVAYRVLFDAETLARHLAEMPDEEAATVPWAFRNARLTAMDEGRLLKVAAKRFDTTCNAIREDMDRPGLSDEEGSLFRLVQAFVADHTADGVLRLRYWRENLYAWRDTHWRRLREVDADKLIVSFLTEHGKDIGSRTLDNFARILKTVILLDDSVEDGAWIGSGPAPGAPDELIPFPNGILHWPTRRLTPCTPGLWNLQVRGFAYDAAATCPRWLGAVGQWFEGEKCAAERELLQEIVGYIVGGSNALEKAFMLFGARRSGKSTTVDVLTALLGEGSVESMAPEQFSDLFGLAHLPGKSLAVLADTRQGRNTDISAMAEKILKITGNDRVAVRGMRKEAVTHRLRARILYLSNEVPRFGDTTATIAERFVVLRFAKSFLGKEDPSVKRDVVLEAPGILNWALEGLGRLMERGRFVVPESSDTAVELLRAAASPMATFAEEHLAFGAGLEVAKDALYDAWRFWCAGKGHLAGSEEHFARTLYSYAIAEGRDVKGVRRRDRDGQGGRRQCFTGVGLVKESADEAAVGGGLRVA